MRNICRDHFPNAGRSMRTIAHSERDHSDVFLKENIGFLKAGELPGAPKTGGWAPSGALDGASGRSPGAVGRVLGARGSVRGAPREVLGALGSSFRRSGDNFG